MHHRANAGRRVSARHSRWGSVVTLAISLSLAAGMAVATAPPASAAAKWSGVLSPNPSTATGVVLGGVACPTSGSCFAVGSYSTASATKTLAMHWNGHNWGILASANPAGSINATLNGVACPTRASCFAVGSYTSGGVSKNLVEHWNGHTWGTLSNPNPSGSTNSALSGVACPSPASCFAVGTYSTSTAAKTLVEHWNGHAWGVFGSPNPTSSAALFAVTCPNTKSCFAVGNYVAGSGQRTLVVRWNGSKWAGLLSPTPPGSTNAGLNGVACPSAKSCFAVGSFHFGTSNRNLSLHWNGSTWGTLAAANPAGTTSTLFRGVSCPSTTSCFAVGYYQGKGGVKSLVEHWNGHGWGVMSSPSPGGIFNHLFGVSCPSTKLCFAVGAYQTTASSKSLTERYS